MVFNAKKNMNILLVNPPLLIHKDFIDYPYFINLGILQNAAVLKEKKYHVEIFDFFSQKESDVYFVKNKNIFLGCPQKTFFQFLENKNFEIIIFGINSFLHPQRLNPLLKNLVWLTRKNFPSSKIIFSDFYFGGMHYIDYAFKQIAKHYPEVNYFVKYETENILSGLIEEIKVNNFFKDKFLSENFLEVKLNTLPYPSWDLINIKYYFQFLQKVFTKTKRPYPFKYNLKILPILATRGCSYHCIFCINSIENNVLSKYRTYEINYLKKYIRKLKMKYKIKGLVFLDNVPNLNKNYFKNLINLLNKENLFYDFPNGLRADKIDKQILNLMKNKITLLSISAESGNQYVINNIIKKKQKIEDIEKVANWCKELNIPLLIHYIIGLPGESNEQINETLIQAIKMKEKYSATPSMQFATPLPGTKLFKICQEKKLLKEKKINDYSKLFTKKYILNNKDLKKVTLEKFKENFELKLNANHTEKIIINLTYRCNNHCIFCAVGDREKVDTEYKTLKEKLRISLTNGVRYLDIDGGEPTLHPELISLIKYAKFLGYQTINLTTNGRMFYYQNLTKEILNSGINNLLISIHGHNDKIHSKHTKEPDSFKQTVEGIKNVIKYKPKGIEVGINTTITKFNYKYLLEFLQFIENLGIDKINIQFVTPFGRATKEILPDPQKASLILKKSLKKFGKKLNLKVINLPLCYLMGYEKYALDDFYKTQRNMIFIPQEEVNLANFLSSKRIKTDECLSCIYNIVCNGFYEFN